MPPQVPYYDPKSPGIQYNPSKAKAEMAKSKYKNGFTVEMLVGAGATDEQRLAQVLQQALKALKINVKFRQVDTSTEFGQIQERKYQLALSYWTMDIADPDELVTFAVDGKTADSWYTGYRNPKIIKLTLQAQRETNSAKRRSLYCADPADRRTGRVHGVPLLLAVPLGHGLEGERLLRHSARELPPGGRLAFVGSLF